MNHSPFSLKVQCYAVFFNLIILSGQSLIIAILITLIELYRVGRDFNAFTIFCFFLPLIWFIVLAALSGVIWIATRNRYQLIAALHQESVNFLVSIVLLLLSIDIITVIVIYFFGYIDAPKLVPFVYIAGVCLNLILSLAAFSIIVHASVQIARRRIYRYPCIVRVLNW